MPQISKFQFETDFAEPGSGHAKSKAEDDSEIEAPVFSEAELLSAREHGYEAGIAAGQAQALGGVEKHVSEVIARINDQLDAINEEMAGQKALAAKDVAILAGAIATKVTGLKSDQSRLDLLERMIKDCMAKLYNEPEVTARVPAELEADLSSRLSMSKLAISISVVPDPALNGTDCLISWDGGGAERIEARIWQDVEALLERYVADHPAIVPPDNTDPRTAQPAERVAEVADEESATDLETVGGEVVEPTELASDVEDAPTQTTSTIEQHGGQPERPAPGDQDGGV